MGYIQKEWVNPVTVNATELNRIEKGIKDSHENLSILNEELSNLQIKQLQNQDEIKQLFKDSPTVLESLKELESLITNNTSILEALKDTSNFTTQEQLNKLFNSFLHITSITQDGNDIFSNGKVTIVSPTVDTILNKTSEKAISNKAVTLALEDLTSKIIIPTKLSDLKEDYNHKLITEDERNLWNTIKDISFTETDPTVPNWAKDPNKPSYEWNEILNTPTIYKHIAEFPDANQYSTTNHNHNTLYALLQHEHDNRYAYVNHKHLEYSKATHDHDSLYAAINHTHDFDTTGVQALLDKEIKDRTDQYNSILSQLGSSSMDYNALLNRPDLSIYALNSALINHDHDSKYSLLSHSHDNKYSLLTHNHNNNYADIDHTHDYSNYFAPLQHNHDVYSLDTHNHDTRYSLTNHNHSGIYSEVTHTHDTSYSKLDHTHTEYSSASHTHDFSSIYAASSHNHDTIYSKLNHTHIEFSSIVDATSIQSMINSSIDELINGADGTYDTLKELQIAIEENEDLLEALNSAISNHNHDSMYAPLSHNHNGYASDTHNHDTVYSKLTHTHTKSEITDFGSYLPTSGGTLTGSVLVKKGTNWGQFQAYSASNYYRAFESNDDRVRIDVRDTTSTSDRRYIDIFSGSAKTDNDSSIQIVRNSATDGTTSTWVATQNWVTNKATALKATTANTVDVTDTTPSSATMYYPLYTTGRTTGQTVRANQHLYYYDAGSWASLNLGAAGSKGILTVHTGASSGDNYVDISPNTLTANRTLTIPDKSGTIAITSDIPTGAAASKGVVTTIDTSANLPTSNAVKTFVEDLISSSLTDYVTLSTAQTISGNKTFTGTVTVPDVTIS